MKKTYLIPLVGMGLSLLTGCVDQSAGAANTSETPRLIATSVAVTEIMEALDLDLIGVPKTTSYTIPERYSEATVVGSPMGPDMEIIKSLAPTEVIGPSSLEADLASQYESIGVSASFIDLKSVQGMYEGIANLGEKYDRQEEAASLVADYEAYMSAYTAEHSEEGPSVLVLMGLPGAYVVATENSYAGNLVSLAGGQNVFPNETDEFINVNTESLAQLDPDYILLTAHAMPEAVQEMFQKEFAENDIWKHFRAVEENHVVYLDHNLFGMSASFDYKEALENLGDILY